MGSNLAGVIVREGDTMKIRMLVFTLTVLDAASLLWSGTPVQADDEPGKAFKD